MTQQISTNTFGVAKWVVSADATQGTHTTIASAITSASSGDTIFIRDGTYTEDFTAKAGVVMIGESLNAATKGTITITGTGTYTIQNLNLTNNANATIISITGSNSLTVNVINCYFQPGSSAGLSLNNANANIQFKLCDQGQGTGLLFTITTCGRCEFINCDFRDGGNSTTASTIAAGILRIFGSVITCPVTSSSTAGCEFAFSTFAPGANTTAFTCGGSGTNTSTSCFYNTGTASSISVGSTLTSQNDVIDNSNTNPIVGAGTLIQGGASFSTQGRISTTTVTQLGPTNVTGQRFTSSGAFTYTPVAGLKYCIVELVGAGGGSGGIASSASAYGGSGGGGGGGYARFILTAAQVGSSLTGSVGAAGTAGAAGANNGGAGGNTTLATTSSWTATGGSGAVATTSTSTFVRGAGAAGGGVTTGTGTVLANVTGGTGSYGVGFLLPTVVGWGVGGLGGASPLGNPGASQWIDSTTANKLDGIAGQGYGAGASGAASSNTNTNAAGAAGAPGIAIFTEFI